MIGVSKRLVLVLAILIAACSPAFAAFTSAGSVTAEATANSVWNLYFVWEDEEDQTGISFYVQGLGSGTEVEITTSAPPDPEDPEPPDPTTERHPDLLRLNRDPEDDADAEADRYLPQYASVYLADQNLYRIAVSAGLNMSNSKQQPKSQRIRAGEAAGLIPDDPDNHLLLRDPRGNPMWYAPSLRSDGINPATRGPIIFFAVVGRGDGSKTVIKSSEISVTVHASSYGYGTDDTVDYGGGGNRDFLETYPGVDWPLAFEGPDPLTPVVPSPVVSPALRPDDGSSSTTYDFRVLYWNWDGLPPKPWLPQWADEFDYYGRGDDAFARETGVVLYLDYVDVFDLGEEHRHEGYRPHFMRKEDPSSSDYSTGVVYLYRLQPSDVWGKSSRLDFFPPTPYAGNDYMSLMTGTYHYFFACSDDSLTFEEDDQYLFMFQLEDSWESWGNSWDPQATRSSTGLDPSLPRTGLVDEEGNDFMPRAEGRRFSSFGDDYSSPKDWQIYVDRRNLVPGRFEPNLNLRYPWPATEHPEVTVALSGFGTSDHEGRGVFFGTLQPLYRAVNPLVVTPWTPNGFGIWALRMETSGATTSTMLTFKVKYYQRDDKPPAAIKVFIGNNSYKVLDPNQMYTPENGGYVGYTMQPSAVQASPGQSQTSPYDYRLGVDYEYKTQLPAGPHTYFFLAYDGTATAIFPARPENWTYNGYEYWDWWVPGYGSTASDPEGFDNNYCPGPYVNHACLLTLPSVTPATGVQGQDFVYRVLYKDEDGQRPYETSIFIETGNPDIGDNGVIKADMVREDPTATDYTQGVWYILNTAALEDFAFAKGIRHYRFEFTDDWGRQTDPNDLIRGETTKLPQSGGWIDGPTIGENFRPTLTDGSVESTDGTSNGATLWKFSVLYKDQNNDPPKYVTVYIGEILSDGQTISWDNGNEMVKADPSDQTYRDGTQYIFLTRLRGAQTASDPSVAHYYAFEASDGANLAVWVPEDYPDDSAWSESAGCLLKDELITSDNIVYAASKTPIVGTLPEQPVDAGILVDPILWRYPAGDLASPEVMTRTGDYVVSGYSVGSPVTVFRYQPVDLYGYLPEISEVLGVYLNKDLTGTDYFHAADGTPGAYDPGSGEITLARSLPYGTNRVWINYHHDGDYTLDRWNGTFTFAAAQDPTDLFRADYFFATAMAAPLGVNLPPTLSNAKLSPVVGTSATVFTYTADYRETEGPNGQPPAFIRVVVDGVARDMQPVVTGTPSYRAGVTYRYTTNLQGGSHNYYFETSDGASLVTLPVVDPVTGGISRYIGPWVNDPPVLADGSADPNPQNDTISTTQPVTYRVTISDLDNDPPIAGVPVVYVDNPGETVYTGSVAELVEDPAQPGKYRLVRVTLDQLTELTTNQFAGKLLQFTDGALLGRAYVIASNTTDTLKLVTDDLVTDGLVVGGKFSVGALVMFKADPAQQNFVAGVTYSLTVPQLAEGEHTFHFKAASVMSPPSWVPPPYDTMTQSAWVRYPVTGEIQGPDVAPEAPSGNHDPMLTMPSGDTPVSPASGKTTDSYDFYVTYSDGDGDPPRYHDGVLGYVRVVFNDDVFAAEMRPESPEDTGDAAFYQTPRRMTASASGLPEGNHKFHFEASDGWVTARWPELALGSDPTANDPVVVVNAKARLTNILITPPSGNSSTTFDLSLKYSDPNDLGPFVQDGKEQVWVEIGSSADKLYLTRNPADTGFAAGVVYSGKKAGLAVGTYTTTFKAIDNAGELTQVSGPVIRVSDNLAAPALTDYKVYNVARPTEINEAATGGTIDTFRYEVKYSDADGDAPLVEQNGQAVEGVQLYIDGQFAAVVTERVGDDFIAGVTYRYSKQGRTFAPGDHTYQFKARDAISVAGRSAETPVTTGPILISAAITMAREARAIGSVSWESRDPKLGETMRISGALTGSDRKPIPGSQKISMTIARPDGTGETFSVVCDSDNRFSFERVLAINKTWTITARWDGNADYKPATVQDIAVDVKGPMRVVATQDMSVPSSTPAVDMVCMPLTSPNRDAGSLFGFDRVSAMQIVRWDTAQQTYLKYGETFFPPLDVGSAVWILPSALYPSEDLDSTNLPSPVDPDYPVISSLKYRLLKPYGRLWDQTADCELTLRRGWNQFGSAYLTPISIGSLKVAYQGQTVTFDQAASKGWIRNYAWMWDPVTQAYKLIHASRPDAAGRTIDPWRGYWIRSFVDCVLVLSAPTGAGGASLAYAEEDAGPAAAPLAALDEPPPAPGSGGRR